MTIANQGSERDTLRQGSASAVPKTNAARVALGAEGRCFLGGRSFSSDTSRPTQTGALGAEGRCFLGGRSFSSDTSRPT